VDESHGGTLPGMASPDVARLARRVDEQDDTVRAISDTVLDIKDTVDQHTETLAAIQHSQTAMQQAQEQQGELLAEILRRLGGDVSGGPSA
jgi:septal ring factor EnvC (AmiA/AmiB activator)